jgi:hypothetical protein
MKTIDEPDLKHGKKLGFRKLSKSLKPSVIYIPV